MTLRSSVNLALLAACATFGLGCEQILGLGDYKESGAGGAHATTSSTSAQGGGGAASTSGAPTSTSSGMAGVEDCENGVDDDMDQAVDCADSDCSVYGCVDLPTGWSPVALGLGPTAPASCPPGYDLEAYHGFTDISFEPTTCSACACLNPKAVCTPGGCGTSTDANCSPSQTLAYAQTVGVCSDLLVNNSTHFKCGGGTSSATCTPSGGVAGALPPATWMTEGRACAANGPGEGCALGGCIADLPATFAFCVMHDGDLGCPAGYPTRHVLSNEPTKFADTRGCSPCECNNGTASCNFMTQFYASFNCTGTPTQIGNSGMCASGPASNSSTPFISSFNPSCPPTGGDAIGDVRPGGATATFCCL